MSKCAKPAEGSWTEHHHELYVHEASIDIERFTTVEAVRPTWATTQPTQATQPTQPTQATQPVQPVQPVQRSAARGHHHRARRDVAPRAWHASSEGRVEMATNDAFTSAGVSEGCVVTSQAVPVSSVVRVVLEP